MKRRIHIWECAKARVEVDEQGKILSVGEPLIKYCPIREYSGWHSETLNSEDIKKSMQWKIDTLGMCKKNRIVSLKIPGIGYGASECLMSALDNNLIETGVVPCDGAGTIVSSDKYVIQGIGMVMPALFSTFPILPVIKRLEKLGAHVIDKNEARIDQVKGVEAAIKLGYKKMGVTVAGTDCKDIETLRKLEEKFNLTILIILIHTTGVTEQDEQYIIKSDIAHGCSSKIVRLNIESQNKYLAKFGTIIPAYAFSELGKKVLELRDTEMMKNPPLLQVKKDAIRKSPFPLI